MITKWKLLGYFSTPFFVFVSVSSLTYFISSISSNTTPLLLEYRLLRTIYVLLSGGVLAISGCLLQSTLRNPLVDHYILGIGSGALFAVYLSVIIAGPSVHVTSLSAVIGGLLALSIVISLANTISGSDVAYVIVGLSVTSLFTGLSILLFYFAAVRYPYAGLMLTGSFIMSYRDRLVYVLAAFTVAYVSSFLISKKLNTLLLGDEYALQLGVNPRKLRLVSSIVAGSTASIVVALFGIIGFIGLISPHISRLTLRTSDNRLVIPIAVVTGSTILYVTDLFSRYIASPIIGEIPSGAVVSAIGAPFFIILVLKRFMKWRL